MARKLETKDFKFTIDKFDDEKGTFTGYASIFGIIDAYGDIVDKGAFKKTLKEKSATVPILWSHSILEPVGVAHLREDEIGLRIDKGELNLDVQRAKELRSLMKQGAVEGVSIGYQTIDAKPDKEQPSVRHLKEVKLWEISPCVFPANDEAQLEDVKTLELKPYPNFHSCRINEPNGEETRYSKNDRKHNGKFYDVIYQKKKDSSDWEEQAYRYPKDTWDVDEAQAHCKDHDGKFEAASGKSVTATLEEIAGWKTDCCTALDEKQQNLASLAIARLKALLTEPPQGTPGPEPPTDDDSKPENLHLLAELNSELKKLNATLEVRQ